MPIKSKGLELTKRERKAVVTAFAVTAPLSLAISMPFGQMFGGPVGALSGVLLIATLLSLLICGLVLRMTRHIERVEKSSGSTGEE
jgi:hypothetical protein